MRRMYLPYLWAWILAAEVIAELEERAESPVLEKRSSEPRYSCAEIPLLQSGCPPHALSRVVAE